MNDFPSESEDRSDSGSLGEHQISSGGLYLQTLLVTETQVKDSSCGTLVGLMGEAFERYCFGHLLNIFLFRR